jgi:alkylation response protein AidB-like acyl-CoA dehydrogenase
MASTLSLTRYDTGLVPVKPWHLAELAATAADADAAGEPDHSAVSVLRRIGLLGLAVPRQYGGAGAGAVAINRCVEQVASVNASVAIMLFQHFAVTARIVESGTKAQMRVLLPLLASGEMLAASAWSETGAGAAKKRLATLSRRAGDGTWLLNGAKSFTTSAGIADIYLVLTQTDDPAGPAVPGAAQPDRGYGAAGQTFFLVRGGNPGLITDPKLALAGMRGSATGFVSLQQCLVDDADRLGPVGEASSMIARVREGGTTLGAVAVGIAQAAVDLAFAKAAQGGLIQSQAVRHRLVEMGTEVEAARSIVERAGRRDSDAVGITTLRSKLFASITADRICQEVQRMLGSAGYVEAHPINRYARDARAIALMGPTNDLCKELVSLSWQR